MKNIFKILFVVVPLFLAVSVSGHTMTVINLTGVVTNYAGTYYMYPLGVSVIQEGEVFVNAWNSYNWWSPTISGEVDYNMLLYMDAGGLNAYLEPVYPDSSIQDAFNKGLYLAAGIVGVLLAFSIVRTIPGGGHEEI